MANSFGLGSASSLKLLKRVAKHGVTNCPSWQGLERWLHHVASKPCRASQCTHCRACPSREARIAGGTAMCVGNQIPWAPHWCPSWQSTAHPDAVHSAMLHKSQLPQLDGNWCKQDCCTCQHCSCKDAARYSQPMPSITAAPLSSAHRSCKAALGARSAHSIASPCTSGTAAAIPNGSVSGVM